MKEPKYNEKNDIIYKDLKGLMKNWEFQLRIGLNLLCSLSGSGLFDLLVFNFLAHMWDINMWET